MTDESSKNVARGRAICIAEDRPALEPAVRLLIASLATHWPGERVELYFTPETAAFDSWILNFPQVAHHRERIPGAYSKYDVKPHAFLALFDAGVDDVIWIDSDIIVAGDIAKLFQSLDAQTIVVTEEALGDFYSDKNGLRARLWGLPVERELPFCLNTGVLRLTSRHRRLVQRWLDLLQGEVYMAAQALAWRDRPIHCLGDQDVLTALLASDEFADMPIKILRRGTDVLQYFGPYGYTLRERLRHIVSGPPPIIHSMGHKPWWDHADEAKDGYERFIRLYREMSPYTLHARRYENELVSATWLAPRSTAARVMSRGAFGSMALHGAPLAVLADVKRLLSRRAARSPATRNG